MASITFKRGDTLQLACSCDNNITGWSILAQVRDTNQKLISPLTVNISQSSPTGVFTLTPTVATSSWPIGTLYMDIQYTTASGQVVSTETVGIEVVRDISFT